MQTVFTQNFLLPLLLLAGINPPLSTALAAGGAPALVPVLQTTFTPPTLAGSFGAALAVMGNDRVVIGAPRYYLGGRAYLFNLNGALLDQFHSPDGHQFGWSVATVPDSGDYVYIGDYVYPDGFLYWCHGNWPNNPVHRFSTTTPYESGDQFSASLAALGNDRLIVGAPNSTLGTSGATQVGSVFLYSSREPYNSTPMTTITNPSPVSSVRFGSSVAGVGDDRILIGAGNSFYGGGDGKAYLFSTNGLLLTSFTNPVPDLADAPAFSYSLAPLGGDRVIIASPYSCYGYGPGGGGGVYFCSALMGHCSRPLPAPRQIMTAGIGSALP